MRRAVVVLVLAALAASMPLAAQNTAPAWDATFRSLTSASNIGDSMRRLSARPHHVGSPYGKDNAEWMAARFKEWGWDAAIETYEVLFPTPKERLVELVAPTTFKAALREPTVLDRSNVGPGGRTAARLQRLLHRRRRDGAARLRQLRPSRRLRRARPPAASRSRAPSSSLAMAHRGAASSRKSPPSTGPSDASFTPIPPTMGTPWTTCFRRDRCGTGTACSAAASSTCRPIPGDPLTPFTPSLPGAKRLALADAPTLTHDSRPADFVRRRAAAAGRAIRSDRASRLARRPCRSPTTSARGRPAFI